MTTPTHLHYRGGSIPVTAVTATHLHFRAHGADHRVSRAALAATGAVRHPELDLTLSLSPPPPPTPTLTELRAAAAAVHPDRPGGSAGAFIEAFNRYAAEKRRAA